MLSVLRLTLLLEERIWTHCLEHSMAGRQNDCKATATNNEIFDAWLCYAGDDSLPNILGLPFCLCCSFICNEKMCYCGNKHTFQHKPLMSFLWETSQSSMLFLKQRKGLFQSSSLRKSLRKLDVKKVWIHNGLTSLGVTLLASS